MSVLSEVHQVQGSVLIYLLCRRSLLSVEPTVVGCCCCDPRIGGATRERTELPFAFVSASQLGQQPQKFCRASAAVTSDEQSIWRFRSACDDCEQAGTAVLQLDAVEMPGPPAAARQLGCAEVASVPYSKICVWSICYPPSHSCQTRRTKCTGSKSNTAA